MASTSGGWKPAGPETGDTAQVYVLELLSEKVVEQTGLDAVSPGYRSPAPHPLADTSGVTHARHQTYVGRSSAGNSWFFTAPVTASNLARPGTPFAAAGRNDGRPFYSTGQLQNPGGNNQTSMHAPPGRYFTASHALRTGRSEIADILSAVARSDQTIGLNTY